MTSPEQPLRIAIIDDDLSVAEIWADFLSEEGHDVKVLIPLEEPLKRLCESGYCCDVLITDFCMPGISGADVIRMAKSMPAPPRVIMVTGYETEKILSADDPEIVLRKPVTLAQLGEAVRAVASRQPA